MAAVAFATVAVEADMRVGIIGLDTSHVLRFTEAMNVKRLPCVEGLRVTTAYQWGSRDIVSATNRYPQYIAEMGKMGVRVVPTIEALIEDVDCICLETNDGREHLWQAEKVFRSGKPCFIDKPLAHNLKDALAIHELGRRLGAKYFSSSCLRYGKVVQAARNGDYGRIRAVSISSPAPEEVQGTHNAYAWYGIHGFEPYVAVMGIGAEKVSCFRTPTDDAVNVAYPDGRLGQLRLFRDRPFYTGYVLPDDRSKPAVMTDGNPGYEPLLAEIAKFFKTGVVPFPPEETLEVAALMEASEMSAARGGVPVTLAEAYASARRPGQPAALTAVSETLTFATPAEDSISGWERESFPIGCGWFGVNVFGIPGNERLQVSDNAVVTTSNRDGRCNTTDAFEIRMKTSVAATNGYSRTLDLGTGIVTVRYSDGDVEFVREYFASYPDRVLVAHWTASRKGALAFELSGEAPFLHPFGDKSGKGPRGRTAETGGDGSTIDVLQRLERFGILWDAQMRVLTDGHCVRTAEGALKVSDATEATVVCSFGSNYRLSPRVFAESDAKKLDPVDPRPDVRRRLDAAAAKGFAALRRDHVKDLGGLMGRVTLDIPDKGEQRFFQFGRYLLVSSSRPGTLPANLQGVWCAHDDSPWGNGYWHNINVQMNYWPAFSCNLAECFEAYAAFNAAFRPTTKAVAWDFVKRYTPESLPADRDASDWWCVGTSVWPYQAGGGPGGHSGPGTGGLTTKCFMDWWEFTRDERALREYVWPTLHGMADFLTRCVTETNGLFLSKFSASPEQLVTPGGHYNAAEMRKLKNPYYQTTGCAFDQQMIWENNNDTLRLAGVLGTNDAVIATIRRQIAKYDPVQIGESGQIKEFREERRYGEIGEYTHRHISQLVGLYPGTLINATKPEWMAAARYSLTERGDRSTGWALAHRLCCWARLGDGDHAHRLLVELLSNRTHPNLWDVHPPFQIDGNFGATAGIAEMLLQSHAGYVDILPALPTAWAEKGSFTGLCARGAYEVDCTWRNGEPIKVMVRSRNGTRPDVRFRGKPCRFDLQVPEKN